MRWVDGIAVTPSLSSGQSICPLRILSALVIVGSVTIMVVVKGGPSLPPPPPPAPPLFLTKYFRNGHGIEGRYSV
jgi:hypothetical protein